MNFKSMRFAGGAAIIAAIMFGITTYKTKLVDQKIEFPQDELATIQLSTLNLHANMIFAQTADCTEFTEQELGYVMSKLFNSEGENYVGSIPHVIADTQEKQLQNKKYQAAMRGIHLDTASKTIYTDELGDLDMTISSNCKVDVIPSAHS